MKKYLLVSLFLFAFLNKALPQKKLNEVVVFPHSTTMVANGEDSIAIDFWIADTTESIVVSPNVVVNILLQGDGKIIGSTNDTSITCKIIEQRCRIFVKSSTHVGKIKLFARAEGFYEGNTDITTISPSVVNIITPITDYFLTKRQSKKQDPGLMLGADISFLPELEAKGIKFTDKGVQKDPIVILKDHGFNYVRLRIFNEPANADGYSPSKGFCDLSHTLQMAKRVKAAGMKLLLDFHYSDYWADPGKQYKPQAWKALSFVEMKKALYDFTYNVMDSLRLQNTLPNMVQVGNEINHGMVWPEGDIQHPDSLAQLIRAGTAAVKQVAPNTVMLIHVALGGQNTESVFFIDQMLKRKVHFDVIGLSYYPRWHGTVDDLKDNIKDLIKRYKKYVCVVEYSAKKQPVNNVIFEEKKYGRGSFIWEPLNTWEKVFDWKGNSNDFIMEYDIIRKKFL